MILVTVGNARQSFRRLIEGVDRLAEAGAFEGEEVLIQTGNSTDATIRSAKAERFLEMDRFARLIAEASLVICHAGNGTLMQALHAGKVPVVMPRRAKYCEHVNDHQMDLVRLLVEEGRIVAADEVDELPDAVRKARVLCARRSGEGRRLDPPLIAMVAAALRELGDRQ